MCGTPRIPDRPQAEHDPLGSAISRLESRQQIEDVILRAGRACDRADIEMLRACYHPDAYDDHGSKRRAAWDFAERALRAQAEQFESVYHQLGPPLVQVAGDHASAETYVRARLTSNGDGGPLTVVFAGRYLDAFDRRDEEWRISQRITVLDQVSTEHPELPPGSWGNEDLFIRGRQDCTDPVYLPGDPDRLRQIRATRGR